MAQHHPIHQPFEPSEKTTIVRRQGVAIYGSSYARLYDRVLQGLTSRW